MIRPSKFTVGSGVVLAVVIITGVVSAATGTHHPRPSAIERRVTTTRRHQNPIPSLPASLQHWVAVSPATTVPQPTPVQLQYDAQFANGLARTMPAAEAASRHVPGPAYAGGWSRLPVSYQPEQWVEQFTSALLGIDFALQSRSGLASWAVANEAPEMIPGVAPAVQNKVLWLSLFEPAAAGGTNSPIPSAARWRANASTDVTWSASQLLIQVDPQWSQIIASGYEPTDTRFSDYDVSGVLSVTETGHPTTTHRFSMQVGVGSAHWRQGYGTVSVSNWSES